MFYRYMSDAERKLVEEAGMLRGGVGAGQDETRCTDERYDSAAEAKRRLALPALPEVRLASRMAGTVHLVKVGSTVRPGNEEPGDGVDDRGRG